MLALCKCTYIFIIENQLTTQKNDKYCPETLTGTAFSIKNADLTMICPKLHVIIIKWTCL